MCGALTFLTPIAFIAGEAEAEEGVDLVDAGASVLTRLWLAVVYICEEEQGGMKLSAGLRLKRMCSAEGIKAHLCADVNTSWSLVLL